MAEKDCISWLMPRKARSPATPSAAVASPRIKAASSVALVVKGATFPFTQLKALRTIVGAGRFLATYHSPAGAKGSRPPAPVCVPNKSCSACIPRPLIPATPNSIPVAVPGDVRYGAIITSRTRFPRLGLSAMEVRSSPVLEMILALGVRLAARWVIPAKGAAIAIILPASRP